MLGLFVNEENYTLIYLSIYFWSEKFGREIVLGFQSWGSFVKTDQSQSHAVVALAKTGEKKESM